MYIKKHPMPGVLDAFDKDAVRILNSILITDTSIEIVVSSDWKYWVSLEEMREFYKCQGIIKSPIAYTMKRDKYTIENYSKQRADEIQSWLEGNIVDAWVSIDDIDMRPYLKNFVWIDKPTEGILQSGARDAILRFISADI
jgi:hypothetical protein